MSVETQNVYRTRRLCKNSLSRSRYNARFVEAEQEISWLHGIVNCRLLCVVKGLRLCNILCLSESVGPNPGDNNEAEDGKGFDMPLRRKHNKAEYDHDEEYQPWYYTIKLKGQILRLWNWYDVTILA